MENKKKLGNGIPYNVPEDFDPLTVNKNQSQPILQDNVKLDKRIIESTDSYLRKMKITADTKITMALLIELMDGFTKEWQEDTIGLSDYIGQQYNRIVELVAKIDERDDRITSLETANLELKAEIVLLDQAAGASAELMVRVMELEEENGRLKEENKNLKNQ